MDKTVNETLEKAAEESQGMGILWKLLWTLVIVLVAFLLLKLVKKLVERMKRQRSKLVSPKRVLTVSSLLYSFLRFVIIYAALVMVLDLFGVNTRAILTAAGIGGVAIAFGAQTLVSDVLSGILLLLSGDLEVGDYVVLSDDIKGTVEKLELRQMTIRNYSGAIHIIPNSQVRIITNYHRHNTHCDALIDVPYTLTLADFQELVKRVAERAKKERPDFYIELPYFVGLESNGPLSYQAIVGAVTRPEDMFQGRYLLRAYMAEELERVNAIQEEGKQEQEQGGEGHE